MIRSAMDCSELLNKIKMRPDESFIEASVRCTPLRERKLQGLSLKVAIKRLSGSTEEEICRIKKQITFLNRFTNDEYDEYYMLHGDAFEHVIAVLSDNTGTSIDEATEACLRLGVDVTGDNGDYRSTYDILKELSEEYQIKKESTIPDLKKKIKHSKNPMEKKMLEKQLNGLYKERKRKYL